MHGAGADRADFDMLASSSLREDNERQPSSRRLSDGAESSFRLGMIDVRQNNDRSAKQTLDLGDRDTVLLAFVLIGFISIKAGIFHASRSGSEISFV
jgi:hypothetical protein